MKTHKCKTANCGVFDYATYRKKLIKVSSVKHVTLLDHIIRKVIKGYVEKMFIHSLNQIFYNNLDLRMDG